MRLKWVQYLEVKGEHGWGGYAYGVCLHRGYLVVVGEAGGNQCTVLLDRADGKVVIEDVNYLSEGSLYNCVSVGNKIYFAGSIYTSLASDGVNLYSGGRVPCSCEDDSRIYLWIIKKRDLCKEAEYRRAVELSQFEDPFLLDMGVDPVTGSLWAVGGSKEYSLILVLDKNLDEIKQIAYPRGSKNYFGIAHGICFDGEGYAYVAGSNGIAKLNSRGKLVAVNKKHKNLTKVACTGNYVYAFGDKRIKGYQRHILVAFDQNLNSIKEIVLSKNNRGAAYFFWGKPAFDGNTLYAAGRAIVSGVGRIVVYAIQITSSNL